MDTDGVLAANAAFYRAFAKADLSAIDALLAREHPVAVIHPGWPAVSGRGPVMETWQTIFSQSPQAVHPVDPQVFIYGEVALVIVYEKTGGVFLAATNIFVREQGDWRIVHHQAGPIPQPTPGSPLM